HVVHGQTAIRVALCMRMARTRRGERLEAERLQVARAAHVPGVGDDETSARVQRAEGLSLVGNGGHIASLVFRAWSSHAGTEPGRFISLRRQCRMNQVPRSFQPEEPERGY